MRPISSCNIKKKSGLLRIGACILKQSITNTVCRAMVYSMQRKLNDLLIRTITAGIFGVIFWGTLVFLSPIYFSLLLIAILIIMLFEWSAFPAWSWAITPVYPILSILCLISLNQNPQYHNLLYYLFIMVFAHDTGAYLVGSLFGKNKILPTISPNKSWEGSAGGFLFSAISLLLMTMLTGKNISLLALLALSFSVALLAMLGDFFESWLKRKADIKNSGSLLPGHGGFLDRFDSILAVSFLFFILRNYLALLLL